MNQDDNQPIPVRTLSDMLAEQLAEALMSGNVHWLTFQVELEEYIIKYNERAGK